MTYFPISSAFDGFRLIVRRPASFLAWSAGILLIFVAIVAINGIFRAQTLGPVLDVVAAFVGLVVITCAVHRAVLRPEARAFAYLRLGAGELRVMGVMALLLGAGALLFAVLGLSITVLTSLLGAVAGGWATLAPGLALVVAAVILGVRLSMVAPIALIEGRQAFAGSWELSRRRFWSLLGLWTVVGLGGSILFVMGVYAVNGLTSWSDRSLPAARAAISMGLSPLLCALVVALWTAPSAGAYRGLTARLETPVEVFD